MTLTRRQFLKWAGATSLGAVVFNGCRVPDHEIQVQSPVELPEDLVTGRDNYYATSAQLGLASEGLLVRIMEGRAKKVEGNPDHPVNTGKHSIRSEAMLQALYHPDRIKHPLLRIAKGGPFRRIDWPEAIERLGAILSERDPNEVLLATPPLRGRLADVVHAFADSYGARLLGFDALGCESITREAISRSYGQSTQPDFDIARSNYVLSFGADFLGTWVNPTHYSRGYGEFRQGKGRAHRGRLVHVESRYSTTAAAADRWLFVNPGAEGLLAMAIAYTIIDEELGDPTAANILTGRAGASALAAFQPARVAEQTGVSADAIVALAREFSRPENRPALAIGGGSAAAQANGLFNMTAVYALNALVGSVNRPGGLLFNPEPRSAPIGAASLREWKITLDDMRSGAITAVLVRDADIVYGLPRPLDPRGALGNVDRIVSFSSFLDETTALADLILPGSTALEEWGSDEPNPGPGYTTVGFQQPVVNRYQDTISFGDALLQAGRQLELTGLPWESMREAVRAQARELHELNKGSVVQPTFEEFWKRSLERGGWWDMSSTVSGGAVPPALPQSAPSVPTADQGRYPLRLVPFEGIGVGAGQYAHLPWAQSTPDPLTSAAWSTWVELNPDTATSMDIQSNDIVTVESATGRFIRIPVYVNPSTPPGVAAIPMGQGHRGFTTYAARRGANVLDIIEPTEEPETGAFAWAATRVRISKTTRRADLPKLEGIEPARQLPGEELIEVERVH